MGPLDHYPFLPFITKNNYVAKMTLRYHSVPDCGTENLLISYHLSTRGHSKPLHISVIKISRNMYQVTLKSQLMSLILDQDF